MRKHFLSGYFSFTKKERTGIVALLSLILFFLLIPFAFPFFIKSKKNIPEPVKETVVSIVKKDSTTSYIYHREYYNYTKPITQPTELFYFDPNTLDKPGWEKLGLRDKTIATIQNYLSKGGKFYKPQDIKKIWGLNEVLADQFIPYIQIKMSVTTDDRQPTTEKPTRFIPYEKKKTTSLIIDINTADTTAFIALPGIGNKLANRIVAFRDKLGGFYSIDQVGETYALPDSVFQKIKPMLVLNDPTVKQININTATIDELKAHPYIRYYLANAILQYRNQHGNFSSINDLKKILLITDDAFIKMEPYLKIN
jgi:competence protein ComEA